MLRNSMKLDLTFSKFVIKPFLASIIMAVCSYAIYIILIGIGLGKLATIIAIGIAVLIYALSVVVLKIFTKEEIFMIPYGQKIYKILEKFGIYKEQQIQ